MGDINPVVLPNEITLHPSTTSLCRICAAKVSEETLLLYEGCCSIDRCQEKRAVDKAAGLHALKTRREESLLKAAKSAEES